MMSHHQQNMNEYSLDAGVWKCDLWNTGTWAAATDFNRISCGNVPQRQQWSSSSSSTLIKETIEYDN